MPDGADLAADVASRGVYRFTAADYQRLAESGVLDGDARVELIEGVIVPMSPVSVPHCFAVMMLDELLRAALEPRFRVRSESGVQLGAYSQPQPDVSVIQRAPDIYRKRHPGPSDILLLAEIAHSSLDRDRRDKIPLYAMHGIAEFWLVNLAAREAEIFRDPADGVFRFSDRIGIDGFLTPLVDPGLRIPLRALFADAEASP
jgi:Uma2 family endonuclease